MGGWNGAVLCIGTIRQTRRRAHDGGGRQQDGAVCVRFPAGNRRWEQHVVADDSWGERKLRSDVHADSGAPVQLCSRAVGADHVSTETISQGSRSLIWLRSASGCRGAGGRPLYAGVDGVWFRGRVVWLFGLCMARTPLKCQSARARLLEGPWLRARVGSAGASLTTTAKYGAVTAWQPLAHAQTQNGLVRHNALSLSRLVS